MSGRKKKQPVVTVEEPEEPEEQMPEDPAVSSASGDDDDDDDDSGAADYMRKMVKTLSAELSKVKIALSKERRQRSATGGRWREQFLNSLKPYDRIEPIEEFLCSFEHYMKGAEVEREDWSLHLVPLLQGDAQCVSNQLDDDCSYEEVKTVLLEYYQVRPDTYWRRLRQLTWKDEGDVGKFCKDAGFLAKKWLESAKDSAEICEWIAVEQIVAGLPSDMSRWLREKEPTSSKEAETLLRQYQFLQEDNQPGARGRSMETGAKKKSDSFKQERKDGCPHDQK